MKLKIYGSKSLNFVELNTTGSNSDYMRCNPESKYMDSIVFNIFAPCFENANKLYDYFNSTRYNSRKIIPLRNELLKNLRVFESIKSIEQFFSTVSSQFLGQDFFEELEKVDKMWRNNWEIYFEKLKIINKELIELVEQCAEQEKILWVKGY